MPNFLIFSKTIQLMPLNLPKTNPIKWNLERRISEATPKQMKWQRPQRTGNKWIRVGQTTAGILPWGLGTNHTRQAPIYHYFGVFHFPYPRQSCTSHPIPDSDDQTLPSDGRVPYQKITENSSRSNTTVLFWVCGNRVIKIGFQQIFSDRATKTIGSSWNNCRHLFWFPHHFIPFWRSLKKEWNCVWLIDLKTAQRLAWSSDNCENLKKLSVNDKS